MTGNYNGLPLQMLWHGVLHHVRNEHIWATGSCEHDPLDDSLREKEWILQSNEQFYFIHLYVTDFYLLSSNITFVLKVLLLTRPLLPLF